MWIVPSPFEQAANFVSGSKTLESTRAPIGKGLPIIFPLSASITRKTFGLRHPMNRRRFSRSIAMDTGWAPGATGQRALIFAVQGFRLTNPATVKAFWVTLARNMRRRTTDKFQPSHVIKKPSALRFEGADRRRNPQRWRSEGVSRHTAATNLRSRLSGNSATAED